MVRSRRRHLPAILGIARARRSRAAAPGGARRDHGRRGAVTVAHGAIPRSTGRLPAQPGLPVHPLVSGTHRRDRRGTRFGGDAGVEGGPRRVLDDWLDAFRRLWRTPTSGGIREVQPGRHSPPVTRSPPRTLGQLRKPGSRAVREHWSVAPADDVFAADRRDGTSDGARPRDHVVPALHLVDRCR